MAKPIPKQLKSLQKNLRDIKKINDQLSQDTGLTFKAGQVTVQRLIDVKQYQVFLCTARPGDIMAQHSHKGCEHFTIISGKVEIKVAGVTKVFSKNTYKRVKSFEVHSIKVISDAIFTCTIVPAENAYHPK